MAAGMWLRKSGGGSTLSVRRAPGRRAARRGAHFFIVSVTDGEAYKPDFAPLPPSKEAKSSVEKYRKKSRVPRMVS